MRKVSCQWLVQVILKDGEEGEDLHAGHEALPRGALLRRIEHTTSVFNTKRPNDIVYVEHVETSIALRMYMQDVRK
jgi:hypothetical protein